MNTKANNNLFRRYIGIGLGVALLGFFAYAFWPEPIPVDMAELSRGPMQVQVRDEGYTQVRDVYVVSAPVSGRLVRIDGEVGDPVRSGETRLARLLPTDPAFLDARSRRQAEAAVRSARAALSLAEAEKAKARAQLKFSQSEARRARRLAEQGSYSGAALERAELALETARAAFETAKAAAEVRAAELENAEAVLIEPTNGEVGERKDLIEIVAPIDGQILRLLRESEAVVSAGTPLIELGNSADMEVVVDVLSRDAVRIETGAPVQIGGWGGENPLEGTVRRVEPYGFTKVSALGIEEQRVNVHIKITSPRAEWRKLGHGFRVDAAITIWGNNDVLRVPTSALFRYQGDWAVFRVHDATAQRTSIELGHNNGEVAQVLAGLQAGDRVVVHPSERIADGTEIVSRERMQ